MRDFVVPSSANYTEFLRDYLVDNELPASLSDADNAFDCDFKETFKQYYLMREIGFDTEEMFKQKLNSQISIMLPYYIEKAEKLKTIFTDIFENGYSILQTNNLIIANSASGSRSNTQTNNLANSESKTTNRDTTENKEVDRTDNATNSEDTTQTNNLSQVIDEDATGKEVNYKTPLGSANDTLPYNAIEGGKTINNTRDNTQTNTGTITTEKEGSNQVVINEDTTTGIEEEITEQTTGSNTGTITNAETTNNTDSQTNTGTITTLYSKNPRFNSLEALTKFQNDFTNIVLECLNSFECLFMQVF